MPWQRKRHRAQQFAAGEDVFHNYRWPPQEAVNSLPANGPGGRPRFNWTPRRSRELIRLIIHTDIRFDHIAAAMKDESGNGPSESTCRDHWHEIFGYTPDVARLKNPQGRSRRFKEHEKAFKAYCTWMEARARYTSIRAEKDADLDDSFGVAPDTETAAPEAGHQESENFPQTRSLLYPVQHLKRTIASSHEHSLVTHQFDSVTANQELSDSSPKCPRDVEIKYGFPQGFIPWIKGASISSTESIRRISANTMQSMRRLSSRARYDSVANATSNPDHRQPSILSRGSILCNYLKSLQPEDDVSISEVERIIKEGEDVNKPNERGETPLHLAVALGSITIVAMLLERGADPKRETDSGVSIWAHGRRASVAAIDPNTEGDYERRRMEIQRMLCARIEFARTTVRYNRDLMTEQKPTKRLRNHGSLPSPQETPSQPAQASQLRPRSRVSRAGPAWLKPSTQPGVCPDTTDDSATTDSDRQTRSSYGPYTPEAIGTHQSTDADLSDVPRSSPSFPLANDQATGLMHGYATCVPQFPVLFANQSIPSNSAAFATADPTNSSEYASQPFTNPLPNAYDCSANFGVANGLEAVKVSYHQIAQAGMIPTLDIQLPSGLDMPSNIDPKYYTFHSLSANHDGRSQHMSMSVLHEVNEADRSLAFGAQAHPHFHQTSVCTDFGIDNIDITSTSATQVDFENPVLGFDTLIHCPDFDPNADPVCDGQERT